MRRSQTLATALPAIACLLALSPGAPTAAEDGQAAARSEEARFVTRVRQLTFEGRRAGEGYFSPDGSKMVFQSEREPGNPFFQIYVLDFTTGETRRISPGAGSTTCAFFRPGSDDILFASTHHDPRAHELQEAEYESRAAGRKRRYNWEFDPEMDLYVARGAEGALERLTNARGYDAEGSYSPDGRWIVFTSTRSAYGQELSDADSRRLENDPSYFGEIYVMRADGSDLRRLTETPGYDGGPFFSPDGGWIVWRRFEADGLIADVWRMRLDGSEKKQLTEFGSMSWAPYPHPSGEYILFTSNKHGFDNFELFVVDFEGNKEPVRVTYTPGFDGLPVPGPDGRRLAWTSTRHGGKQGQIMLADWNHAAVQEALKAAPPRGSAPRESE
jgi:Tol biopolymer transport system component